MQLVGRCTHKRSDWWATSLHWPPSNMLAWMSSRTANKAQHAAFVAVFTPSGQATRRVIAPEKQSARWRSEVRRREHTLGGA